jgi:hypothetical protein
MVVALVLVAGPVTASEAFPPVVKAELRLKAAPDCTLCHRDDQGGVHTVTKPFGLTMLGLGVTGGNVGSLEAALRTDEADATDSDGDGVPDVDELRNGTDPNVPQATDGGTIALPKQPPLPETGCSVSTPVDRTQGLPFASGVIALGALVLRRRLAGRRSARAPAHPPSSRIRGAEPASKLF